MAKAIYSKCPLLSAPKTGDEKQVDVAMFLPHEMIAALLRVNEGMDILRLQEEELSNRRDTQEHLEALQE